MDIKALVESRKTLLKNGDYIIPGHGKMFKVGDNPKLNVVKEFLAL